MTATANLSRTLRQDKIYSRAQGRYDLMKTIDEDLVDEFEFPIVAPDDELDVDAQTLAQLMVVSAPTER